MTQFLVKSSSRNENIVNSWAMLVTLNVSYLFLAQLFCFLQKTTPLVFYVNSHVSSPDSINPHSSPYPEQMHQAVSKSHFCPRYFPPKALSPPPRLAEQLGLSLPIAFTLWIPPAALRCRCPTSSFLDYYVMLVEHILQEFPEKEMEGKFVETMHGLKYHSYSQICLIVYIEIYKLENSLAKFLKALLFFFFSLFTWSIRKELKEVREWAAEEANSR